MSESDTEEPELIDGPGLIEHLVEAGMILEADDDLELTDPFRREWRTHIAQVRDTDRAREVLGTEFDVEPEQIELIDDDTEFAVLQDGTTLGTWPSEAMFVADLGLYLILDDWFSLWERLDGRSRAELLSRLRGFLDQCPLCEGDLEMHESLDEATGHTDVSMRCIACDSVVFEGSFV